jgi:hypothetical protein
VRDWLLGLAAGGLVVACGTEPPAPPDGPVERPAPVRLVLTASDTAIAPGGVLLFRGVALDSAGEVVGTSPVAWSVSDTLRGWVTGGGVFTGGPDTGRVYVRATAAATPALADSIRLRIVPPGTVKWTWAAASVGGVMPVIGGPALGSDGTVYVLVEIAWPAAVLVALAPDGSIRCGSSSIPTHWWTSGSSVWAASRSGIATTSQPLAAWLRWTPPVRCCGSPTGVEE